VTLNFKDSYQPCNSLLFIILYIESKNEWSWQWSCNCGTQRKEASVSHVHFNQGYPPILHLSLYFESRLRRTKFCSPIYIGLIKWRVHYQLDSVLHCYCSHSVTYLCSFLPGLNFTVPLCSTTLRICATTRTSTRDGGNDVCCCRRWN